MALTLDKPILGLRASLISDAVAFVPREGFCDGIVLDTPYVGLRAGLVGDNILFVIGDQKLEPDGKLTIDKPYIGLRAGQAPGGELLFVLAGKQCGEPYNPTFCDCTICCTLDGTVEIGNGASWYSPVDVTLTCGGQVPFTTCYSCLNDEIEDDTIAVNYENYWRGKTTLGVPFDEGPAGSGTYDYYSEVWSSETFVVNSETYQLHFFAVQRDRHRVLPTPAESTTCGYGYVLKKYVVDLYGQSQWVTIMGGDPSTLPIGYSGETYFELELNPVYDPGPCPPGYSENGGDCVDPGPTCSTPPPGYSATGTESSAYCDPDDGTYLIVEQKFTLGGPDINCARFSIFDNCEPA